MSKCQVVWVTGASTGIGRELCLQLAARGDRVAASARSRDKLAQLAGSSSGIESYPLDVTDTASFATCIDQIERDLGPIDMAILNAGLWEPLSATEIEFDAFARSMDVNYLGIVRALAVLVPLMRARGRGHIALVASVSGYRGLPKAAAYGPTKAAIINLAESIAPELAPDGITISVVNPGFVDTPMTARNDFPMPFIMPPERAARIMLAGLDGKKFEIAFPWQLVTILKIARLLPYRIFFWLIAKTVLRRKAS